MSIISQKPPSYKHFTKIRYLRKHIYFNTHINVNSKISWFRESIPNTYKFFRDFLLLTTKKKRIWFESNYLLSLFDFVELLKPCYIKDFQMVRRKSLMAPLVGLEPTTYRLTAERSTNWAKEEYIIWQQPIFSAG